MTGFTPRSSHRARLTKHIPDPPTSVISSFPSRLLRPNSWRGAAVVGTVDDLARLRRTRCIALLREMAGGRILAIAAWEQPAVTYRRGNFTRSPASIADFKAALELGYVVITPDMRGKQLSGGLVDKIVAQIAKPTFVTTYSPIMCNNLKRSSFTRVGNEWQGKKHMISL